MHRTRLDTVLKAGIGCISLVPAKAGYNLKTVLDSRYGGECRNTTAPLTVFSAADVLQSGRKWMNLQIQDGATNWYCKCITPRRGYGTALVWLRWLTR